MTRIIENAVYQSPRCIIIECVVHQTVMAASFGNESLGEEKYLYDQFFEED